MPKYEKNIERIRIFSIGISF